jgi:hypothetical protein
MKLRTVARAVAATLMACAFGMASAKLPALTDDQKAKTAEAKAGEAAKKEAELLGKYQDCAVENYKRAKAQKTLATVKP